jgi:hypothetical protein
MSSLLVLVWLWGGGVELCCRPILQEFNTLFLTRVKNKTKTPVKATFRDWCLFSSFFHGMKYRRTYRLYVLGDTHSTICTVLSAFYYSLSPPLPPSSLPPPLHLHLQDAVSGLEPSKCIQYRNSRNETKIPSVRSNSSLMHR